MTISRKLPFATLKGIGIR